MRRHDFVGAGDSPYCGTCSLPEGNAAHRSLNGLQVTVGPFASDAAAKKFAEDARRKHPHVPVEVVGAQDPEHVQLAIAT